MSFEMVGQLYELGEVQQISDTFKKREIVIEHSITRNDRKITDFIKFQLTGERCNLVNDLKEGALLKIFFNIKGRKIIKDNRNNYYINLDVWKLESISKQNFEKDYGDMEINDFLPF